MKIDKRILIPIGIGVASVAMLSTMAFAKVDNNGTLVDQLATRFNLNKADVQKVFDEHRAEKRADREKNYEDRLQKAVDAGKLTSEQRDKVLAKHKELVSQMQADRDSMKDKTPEERKSARDAKRSEIEQWEKDNNIPAGYLMMDGHGGPRGGGMHRGGMMGGDGGGEPNVN